MKFKLENPKRKMYDACVVQCPDYCFLGYVVAVFDGHDWRTDDGNIITDYVIGWISIK
jgi:hypothetical protein